MAYGDLRDLRQAPEVPRGRLSHGISVALGPPYTFSGLRRAQGPGGVNSDSTRR
jgi:hypothetical protein